MTACRTAIAKGDSKSSSNGTSPGSPRGSAGRQLPRWLRLTKELLLAGAFCAVYEALRHGMVQSGSAAIKHALWLVRLESDAGLFHEASLQAVFLHVPNLVRAFNLYYGATHFVIPIVALVWLGLRAPRQYTRARTALAAMTGLAFCCFWLFPEAPPRLLPSQFGFADTLDSLGKSGHLESSLLNTAGDIYAAMPSLHVAWAVWCTLALYPAVRGRALRIVLVAYPVMTTLVVVVTGNHFFLDAAAGALLAGLTWLAVSHLGAPLRALAAAGWSAAAPGRRLPVPVPVAASVAPQPRKAAPDPAGTAPASTRPAAGWPAAARHDFELYQGGEPRHGTDPRRGGEPRRELHHTGEPRRTSETRRGEPRRNKPAPGRADTS